MADELEEHRNDSPDCSAARRNRRPMLPAAKAARAHHCRTQALSITVSSRLQLPPGPWRTVLDCVCARFPAIARETWIDRFARGRVLDAQGTPLPLDAPYRVGAEIRYFREVPDEAAIPFRELLLHADAHLVVADKPHFLPVAPTGRYLRETLLSRLAAQLGNPDLVPLHRIDRDTAGLVLFSADRDTRDAYLALFRRRAVRKRYEALAAALPEKAFPLTRATRLAPGDPFFRMREIDGAPNSETRIGVIERIGDSWRYTLEPITGRKHQLRVHMAALGAPIRNDPWYPELVPRAEDDYTRPLKLLARSLSFVDPLSGEARHFESDFHL
jgi:tRNA pseudouridine32 synthase / 23S rRNA pseudouridine746 synthase